MNAHAVRSTPFELTVRKQTRFEFSELDNAIHTEGNLYISHFFNALSLVTPITEGILIRAIREIQPSLEGSGLEADASAFIGQEAIHTREHRALNRRLAELGVNAEKILEELEAGVKELEASLSLQERLALVITGEHAIYSVARALLTSDYVKCQQQNDVKSLFAWHALEEMEHQSVCDDIYRYLYGWGIKHRLIYFRMFPVAGKLLVRMLSKLMKGLLEDSRNPEKNEYREFLRWLLRKPGVGVIITKELLAFFSPRFAHWRRVEEDQKLIQLNLQMIP